jgi:hypothetical protein
MKDPGRGSCPSQYCLPGLDRVGVEPGGRGSGRGGLAHCWALRDQPVGWLARSLLSPVVCCCARVVVGGFVV